MSCIPSRVQEMRLARSLIWASPGSQSASVRCKTHSCSVRCSRFQMTTMRSGHEPEERELRVPILSRVVSISKSERAMQEDTPMKWIATFHARVILQRKSFWWKPFMNFSNLLENQRHTSKSWDKGSRRTSISKVITSSRWSIKSNHSSASTTKTSTPSSAKTAPTTFVRSSRRKTCSSWCNSTVTTKMGTWASRTSIKWCCQLATPTCVRRRLNVLTSYPRIKIIIRSPSFKNWYNCWWLKPASIWILSISKIAWKWRREVLVPNILSN